MSFVIVNYLNTSSPYETYDVHEDKILKRKTTLFENALRVASFFSYIPTTYSLIKYFLRIKK
jgi:hypothetical protein